MGIVAALIEPFYGHLVIVTLNAAMGLPPVVAGLVVYLLLSRAGPFGSFGLLFTPVFYVAIRWLAVRSCSCPTPCCRRIRWKWLA